MLRTYLYKIGRALGTGPYGPIWNPPIIALHEYKCLYFVIPKVACSSLRAVCADLLNFELPKGSWTPNVFANKDYDKYIDRRKRNRASLSISEVSRYQDYWKFAFIRDPLDRLVSCYSEKIREVEAPGLFVNGVARPLLRYGVFHGGMSFSDFVHEVAGIPDEEADVHFRSQWTFVCDEEKKLIVDFLGRFEHLMDDMEKVAKHLGRKIALPHYLKSNRSSVDSYYTDELREVALQRYELDYELLFSGKR